MFTSVSKSSNADQYAVLLQLTPLSQLDPESLMLLEVLSENSLESEEAYYRVCEGDRAHCLVFVKDDQAIDLMEALRGFENGLSLDQITMTHSLSLTQ